MTGGSLAFSSTLKSHKDLNLFRLSFAAFLIMLCAAGCDSGADKKPSQPGATGTIHGTIQHGGVQREYILYVPGTYTQDNAWPLVLNYHGYGSNAAEQMEYGDFRPLADQESFIVVHPLGVVVDGNTQWNVGGGAKGGAADDVAFTDALIKEIEASYSLDSTRIYATGMSNGGYMSFFLACMLSETIAAAASVTGSMTKEMRTNCDPGRRTAIMQIHGTKDSIVPYDGNEWSLSIDSVMQFWASNNQCADSPVESDVADINKNDGSTVAHVTYGGCAGGYGVEHYRVVNGGHTWPGAGRNYPFTNYDIDASAEIWRFFNQHDINGRRGAGN